MTLNAQHIDAVHAAFAYELGFYVTVNLHTEDPPSAGIISSGPMTAMLQPRRTATSV